MNQPSFESEFQAYVAKEIRGTGLPDNPRPVLSIWLEPVATLLWAPKPVKINEIGTKFVNWYNSPIDSADEPQARDEFAEAISDSNEIRPGEREIASTPFDDIGHFFNQNILGKIEKALKASKLESTTENNVAKAKSFDFLKTATEKTKKSLPWEQVLSYGSLGTAATLTTIMIGSTIIAASTPAVTIAYGIFGALWLGVACFGAAAEYQHFKRRKAVVKMGDMTLDKLSQMPTNS